MIVFGPDMSVCFNHNGLEIVAFFIFAIFFLIESYRKSGREFREHVDMMFNNVQHIMWELWAKNAFALKIAPPAGYFWCVSYRGQSIPPL